MTREMKLSAGRYWIAGDPHRKHIEPRMSVDDMSGEQQVMYNTAVGLLTKEVCDLNTLLDKVDCFNKVAAPDGMVDNMHVLLGDPIRVSVTGLATGHHFAWQLITAENSPVCYLKALVDPV